MFLLACACSVSGNAGRLCENSFQQVLIVLVPRQLKWMIEGPELRSTLLWCPRQHHGLSHFRGMVHVNGCISFRSATPTCIGDHESLEAAGVLVEVKWKWMSLR